jgi:hypothetical protein
MAWDAARAQMLLVVAAGTGSDGETWTWDGIRWVREAHGDLVVLVIASTMAYDPVSETVLMGTPLVGDSARTPAFGWNGSSWHALLAERPEFDGLAAGESVIGLGKWVNRLVVCGSVTSSAIFAVQANCWEWESTSWSRASSRGSNQVGTPVMVAAEVDDLHRAQLLMICWLVAPVSNRAEPLYVWGVGWHQVDASGVSSSTVVSVFAAGTYGTGS